MRELRASLAGLDEVQEALQFAIELELTTIPPYLYALWSIKDPTSRAAQLIRGIVAEEMLHMALAANILNALGGSPKLTDPTSVPTYPTALPGGVEQEVTVRLRRCDRAQLELFKAIEAPKEPVEVHTLAAGEQPVTIGQFYEAIAAAVEELGPGGFTGDPGRQLRHWPVAGGRLEAIDTPEQARRAIDVIREQGEGTSAKDPTDRDRELGHYYLFWEILQGREIVLVGSTWKFAGAAIPAPEVLALVDEPTLAGYAEGSQARKLAAEFNTTYGNLLRSLERAFTGEPDQLRAALGLMYSLRVQAQDLARQPSGRPDGSMAGPTFEYPAGELA